MENNSGLATKRLDGDESEQEVIEMLKRHNISYSSDLRP